MAFKTFLFSFFSPQTLETADSAVNGSIKAIKFFGQNKLEAGGLTQSGEYVEDLLAKGLKKIRQRKPKDILILGLGGGSIVKRINKLFPEANIVGVEIDPVMVELGKKYLSLTKVANLEIIIDDAVAYVRRLVNLPAGRQGKRRFDLILVDLYLGYEFPKAAESSFFLKNLQKLVRKGGVVIINRLYFSQYKETAENFISKVKDVFSQVSSKKIYSNLLIFAER